MKDNERRFQKYLLNERLVGAVAAPSHKKTRILVEREKQPPYRTEFYGCVGCLAMFTDPYQFTQGGKPGGNFGSSSYKRS